MSTSTQLQWQIKRYWSLSQFQLKVHLEVRWLWLISGNLQHTRLLACLLILSVPFGLSFISGVNRSDCLCMFDYVRAIQRRTGEGRCCSSVFKFTAITCMHCHQCKSAKQFADNQWGFTVLCFWLCFLSLRDSHIHTHTQTQTLFILTTHAYLH